MSKKCLSCDNRYRFFDIVLHVLVMWGRQLNSSSMIMARCLLYVIIFETKIKDKRAKLMFLPGGK